MAKRKKAAYRRKNQNRFSMFLVSLVVVMILVVVAVKSIELNAKSADNREQIDSWNAKIAEEQMRKEELEEQGIYMKTKQWAKEMANKMGLVFEDEILFEEKDK